MTDLMDIYNLLLKKNGPQHWWPGDSPFEVMVGAILTQNTSWSNVEKAINNLKENNLLSIESISDIKEEKLAELIKPAGYFNQKTFKLKRLVKFLNDEFNGDIESMKKLSLSHLRESLLSINGIGPETADSILLYALQKPIFVIDTYTARLTNRLEIFFEPPDYHTLQEYFMDHILEDIKLYNDFHAQIVVHGKDTCKKSKPKCDVCPLSNICPFPKHSNEPNP